MAGLSPFYAAQNDPSSIKIACLGDSTVYGTGTTNNLGWPGALRSLMANRWGTGSDGIYDSDRSMAFTTSGNAWTKATTSDAWDVSMGLATGAFSRQAVYLANGSAKIVTWTKPSYLTVTGFKIWAVDGPSSASFSYSLDGGTSWINVSQTWAQDNSIKQIYIRLSVTGTNTVKVRGANAAGTGVNCYFIGIEPISTNNTFTIHNLAAAGENSSCFYRTTAGNWHAWLDLVQPQLVTYQMTNDVALVEALNGTDMNGFIPYVQGIADAVTSYGGSFILVNFFEQVGRSVTLQAQYRAINKSIAAAAGMPCLDLYDLVGDGPTAISAGYVNVADIHPSDAGATFIAQQVWKIIGKSGVGARQRV